MLPNVNTDYGNVSEKRILVGCGDDLQLASGGVNALTIPRSAPLSGKLMRWETYEPAPARALDASSSRVELLLERFQRAPTLADGSLERAFLEHAAGAPALSRRGREVLPEERVVDVACGHPRDIRWTDR